MKLQFISLVEIDVMNDMKITNNIFIVKYYFKYKYGRLDSVRINIDSYRISLW